MRLLLVLLVLGGLVGTGGVLYIASLRQLENALAQRAAVETIADHMKAWLAETRKRRTCS